MISWKWRNRLHPTLSKSQKSLMGIQESQHEKDYIFTTLALWVFSSLNWRCRSWNTKITKQIIPYNQKICLLIPPLWNDIISDEDLNQVSHEAWSVAMNTTRLQEKNPTDTGKGPRKVHMLKCPCDVPLNVLYVSSSSSKWMSRKSRISAMTLDSRKCP